MGGEWEELVIREATLRRYPWGKNVGIRLIYRYRIQLLPGYQEGIPTCIPDGVHKVVPSRFREQLELTSTEGSFLAQESNGPASDGGVTVTVLQAEKGWRGV